MHVITDPFVRYGFMQTALVAAVLISISCALLGTYVVLRRMAFIGDALAHTALPGLVLAYLAGVNLFLGAVAAAVTTAISIGIISRRQQLREDAAIGVIFTAMFALGVLLIGRTGSFRDFSHLLFGNILGVTGGDLVGIAFTTTVVVVVLGLLHKELQLTSVDPIHAQVIGLSPDRLRDLLLILLALTVVSGIYAVGVILTSALLITPAAAASLLTRRLPTMMLTAMLIAMASSVAGLYWSFYGENVSTGAAIVLACFGCFVGAWLYNAWRRGSSV